VSDKDKRRVMHMLRIGTPVVDIALATGVNTKEIVKFERELNG